MREANSPHAPSGAPYGCPLLPRTSISEARIVFGATLFPLADSESPAAIALTAIVFPCLRIRVDASVWTRTSPDLVFTVMPVPATPTTVPLMLTAGEVYAFCTMT